MHPLQQGAPTAAVAAVPAMLTPAVAAHRATRHADQVRYIPAGVPPPDQGVERNLEGGTEGDRHSPEEDRSPMVDVGNHAAGAGTHRSLAGAHSPHMGQGVRTRRIQLEVGIHHSQGVAHGLGACLAFLVDHPGGHPGGHLRQTRARGHSLAHLPPSPLHAQRRQVRL